MFKAIPMFSGSSGNSTYIKYGSTEILIDAGVSFKSIKLALQKLGTDISNISAVFVTHEHTDHIKGLEVFAKTLPNVPIFINDSSLDSLNESSYAHLICSAERKNPGDVVTLPGVTARSFKTPHDSFGSVCYRFDFDDGSSFGYATDIGKITPEIRGALYGCETVVLESNHDIQMLKNGHYPYILKKRILGDFGHLSNDACADFAAELVEHGTEKIILAHLSNDNNTPEAAYRTTASFLTEAGFTPEDVKLSVAMRSIL